MVVVNETRGENDASGSWKGERKLVLGAEHSGDGVEDILKMKQYIIIVTHSQGAGAGAGVGTSLSLSVLGIGWMTK